MQRLSPYRWEWSKGTAAVLQSKDGLVTTGRLNKSGESANLALPSCVRMALSVPRSVGQFVRTILSLFLTDLLPVQKCRLGKRFIEH